MTDHPNATLIREGYTAMAQGDPTAVLGALSPDVEWNIAGKHRFSGTYEGVDALLQHFGELFAVGQEEMTVVDVVANDRRAFALVDVVTTAAGRTAGPDRNVHVFEFGDDGKVARFFQYPWDVHAEEELWATTE